MSLLQAGFGSSGDDYTIDDSLRFRASASAYLNRTPASAGNRKTWTLSWWAKRGALGSTGFTVFSAGTTASDTGELVIKYDNNYPDSLAIQTGTTNIRFTNALYRDPSAWHHVVVAFDTTQATAANRHKVYVNGEEITSFNLSNNLAQNTDTAVNNNVTQEIGVFARINTQYFDGYLTEVQMIDGQQLTADDFGEYDANGTWKPKEYTGTYGTNGFYLPFRNPTVGTVSADYLVVAGGGGGTYANAGGGGEVIESTSQTLSLNTSYAVTVGAGGAGGNPGADGSNSVFATDTANSGKRPTSAYGAAGTSGNGTLGGTGRNVGSPPFLGGGGGGDGQVGANASGSAAGAGGNGTSSSITGTPVLYGAGGGGGAEGSGTRGLGGNTGGGNGTGVLGSPAGSAGAANTGGGGGGGDGGNTTLGHAGGSGVVIISYAGAQQFNGGTITSSGGNTIHTFTTSDILTPVFNDSSGNDNNWTGNNFNVSDSTATTYDLMKDTPSLVDENAGNFCTLNPLDTTNSATAPTNGNLTAPTNVGAYRRIGSTIQLPRSGKWYFETHCDSFSSFPTFAVGLAQKPFDTTGGNSVGTLSTEWGYNGQSGTLVNNNTAISSGVNTVTTNDIMQIAYDGSTGKVWFGKNNTWQGAGSPNPATDTAPNYTGVYDVFPVVIQNWAAMSINFGQRPFAYTPPTGFKKLNTFNLPDSTIEDGSDYFNTVLYTGNGGAQAITGVGFTPSFIWAKSRSNAYDNLLVDAVRGGGFGLKSNTTGAELASGWVSSFNSDGFTYNVGGATPANANGATYVAWNWKANGSGVSNTDGSITSTVSATTTAGFSIVSYTGTGANATVGHGLGVAPSMMIVKGRDSAGSWAVYHANANASPASGRLYLQLPNAFTAQATAWNSTVPSSTVFSVGSLTDTNQNTNAMIAYCFAPVEDYSSFGSYTGNGSTDGPFVYTGFRPAWVLFKRVDNAFGADWIILDTARDTYNSMLNRLNPNGANAENATAANLVDYTSNGFKIRSTLAGMNTNGGTIIYAAFAENPFKNANAR